MQSDQGSQVRANAIRGVKAGCLRSGVLVRFGDAGTFRIMLESPLWLGFGCGLSYGGKPTFFNNS